MNMFNLFVVLFLIFIGPFGWVLLAIMMYGDHCRDKEKQADRSQMISRSIREIKIEDTNDHLSGLDDDVLEDMWTESSKMNNQTADVINQAIEKRKQIIEEAALDLKNQLSVEMEQMGVNNVKDWAILMYSKNPNMTRNKFIKMFEDKTGRQGIAGWFYYRHIHSGEWKLSESARRSISQKTSVTAKTVDEMTIDELDARFG